MAHAGDVIENPLSGETMVFLQTAEDTDGELLQVELFVKPDGGVAGEHVHPHQEERFLVKYGQMTIRMDGRERVLRAGQEAIVPPGVVHEWWNSGDTELNAIIEFRSAGRVEGFLTTFFGLAKAGQLDRNGTPGLLQTAVTLHAYRDTVVVPSLPPVTRSIALPALSLIGRALGLRPDYPYPRSARVNLGMEIWRPEAQSAGEAVPAGETGLGLEPRPELGLERGLELELEGELGLGLERELALVG